jgi:hypothetical protein
MPSPHDYLTDDDLDAAVLEAQRLAFVVHEYDREQVHALISHIADEKMTCAVMVVLAAMVDIDKPVSELLGWVLAAAERKPWERAWYPECDPAQDKSTAGARSRHGTPSRHTAGCRGAGCRLARKDYDAWHLYGRTPD